MFDVDQHNLETLREEYERQMASLGDLQRQVSEISATAVSPRRELSVTVGHQGAITELKFLTSGYRRMAKNELSELVTRTIAEARDKMNDQIAEIMAPMMPPGVDAKAMLSGDSAIDQLAPDESKLPPVLREHLSRPI